MGSRRLTWIAASGAIAGAIVVLYLFDPSEGGFFPPCIFHLTTGLACPGCGLTRAVHHLLHGDVAGAFALNAMFPLYLVLLGSLLTGWLWRETRGYTPRLLRMRTSAITASAIAMIAFGVLRNLPA